MTLGVLVAPGVSLSQPAEGPPPEPTASELDAGSVPWETLERLCLEAGIFPPRYRPLGAAELAALMERVAAVLELRRDPAATVDLDLARAWRDHFSTGGPALWRGCECREPAASLHMGGTVRLGTSGLGDPAPGQAGRAWSAGTNLATDLRADLAVGRWWLGGTVRAGGRLLDHGTVLDPDDPLAWPDWPAATGRPAVGAARSRGGAWSMEVPRLAGGVSLGSWALTLGQASRRVGPGLGGGLTLDADGAPFPAGTIRRTRPFARSGWMRLLAPDDLLLRCGRVSNQEVRHRTHDGVTATRQHPWFFQWLVGWRPVSWFRFTATHTAVAARLDDHLWGDLLRINFPLAGTPLKERRSGLATDRLFALQFELRWRDAPWPVLPSRAGRVYWEYAGTDVLTGDPAGLPRIAAPASLVGAVLVDPRWDLAAEYAGLRHDLVLWYSNSSFPAGYTHQGWLLGQALGGSGREVTGRIRVRPGRRWETGLEVARRRWGMDGRTPGAGNAWSVGASVGRLPRPDAPLWTFQLEWRQEEAKSPSGTYTGRRWWRGWITLEVP
ncbi:MAG: capsule assembly Wzi family protein [bacterium]|nr:capsule assembly Wzi family protein [bacterium]